MTKHEASRRALDAETAMRDLNGADLIAYAQNAIADTQAELSRLSGLNADTIRAIGKGRRVTRAQRAALCWAVFRRWAA